MSAVDQLHVMHPVRNLDQFLDLLHGADRAVVRLRLQLGHLLAEHK
jgi:hypothetical protein